MMTPEMRAMNRRQKKKEGGQRDTEREQNEAERDVSGKYHSKTIPLMFISGRSSLWQKHNWEVSEVAESEK